MKDTLKRFTDFILFDHLPRQLEKEDITFTATDINYDDDCSAMTFKVAEAPGWLFGIWYTIQERPSNFEEGKVVQVLDYAIFGQYERFIDKFTPSYSVFCEDDWIENITPDYEFFDRDVSYDLEKMFSYIINEPALAFCRDVFWFDYNYKYVSGEEAEILMEQKLEKATAQEAFEQYANDALLNYVKNFWKGETVYIHDFGESVSPRYEVTFLYEDFEDDTRPIHERICGIHYLDDIESQENDPSDFPDDIKIYQFFLGYRELETRLEKEAKEHDFYWWPAVSSFFTYQSMSHYEAWKQRVKNETGKNIEDELIYC